MGRRELVNAPEKCFISAVAPEGKVIMKGRKVKLPFYFLILEDCLYLGSEKKLFANERVVKRLLAKAVTGNKKPLPP